MEKLEKKPEAKDKQDLINDLRDRILRLKLMKDELKIEDENSLITGIWSEKVLVITKDYEIKGNVIIFNVDRIVQKNATVKLSETLQFKFPITPVSEVSFMDGKLTRQMLKIGSYEYYLYYNDPRS